MMKSGIVFATMFSTASALAAADLGEIRLDTDVVPAPYGYEAPSAKYLVAVPTNLYISPYIYPGTVNSTKLTPGQAVDILAKAKGYDWMLVGKNGVGIGYVPLSRLVPANKNAR